MRRDDGDWAHFLLISFWDSLESIQQFAGDDIDTAVLYPEDEVFGLVPDLKVFHYNVLRTDTQSLGSILGIANN